MGIFTTLASTITQSPQTNPILNFAKTVMSGIIDHGRNKDGGGHDHRTNTGKDRTPAQKQGDQKRRKGD